LSVRKSSARLISEFTWRPMGRNSTAIVLQAAVLPVTFEDTGVLAALLLAVALSQAIVLPVKGEVRHRTRADSTHGEHS